MAARRAISRRAVLKGAGALAVAGPTLARQDATPAASRRDNVLFIITDQHRADVAGFAGNPYAATPNLDRLAREGTHFTRMYCQAPLCVPARQSLLTGLYPHGHGSFRNWVVFPDDQWTLGHAFTEAGYETAFFGKEHCNTKGFRTVVGTQELKAEWQTANGGAPLKRTPEGEGGDFIRSMNPGTVPAEEGSPHIEDLIATRATRFLEERSGEAPFCLWASFLQPHPPLFPPEEYLARFRAKDLPFAGPTDEPVLFADLASRRKNNAKLRDDEWLGITRSYYAAVAWSDHCLGRLLDALDALGLADDTLVVYTSDHGEMLGEHGLLQKRTLYDGALRVPCILRRPGRIRAGGVVERVTQHVDLTAGLVDLSGLPPRPGLSGRSLRPLLEEGAEAPWEDMALAELLPQTRIRGGPRGTRYVTLESDAVHQMLRVGNEKYIQHSEGQRALFDLALDPGEMRNLAAEEERAESLAAMRKRLAGMVPAEIRVLANRKG